MTGSAYDIYTVRQTKRYNSGSLCTVRNKADIMSAAQRRYIGKRRYSSVYVTACGDHYHGGITADKPLKRSQKLTVAVPAVRNAVAYPLLLIKRMERTDNGIVLKV